MFASLAKEHPCFYGHVFWIRGHNAATITKIFVSQLQPFSALLCLSSYCTIFISRNLMLLSNRPLPSSKNPHFQNEARYTTFLVKMSFICIRKKNDFRIKGWAPTLVLKQRPRGTQKWPIHLWLLLQVMYYFVSLCNPAWATKKNEGFASCG